MDRRDLLKLGVAATVAGCAGAPKPAVTVPPLSAQEADAILADLDATLARLRSSPPATDVFLGANVPDSPRLRRGHELTTKALASMHVAATFRELPPEVQARPDVQERMWRAMPDMDDSMMSLTDFLEKLTPAERRALQARLRSEPDLGMKVVEKLDDHAKTAGLGAKRRSQMRAAAAHVSWRMQNQSVDALLDECVDKTRRVTEHVGRDAEVQRAAAAKLTELGLFGPEAGGTAHLTLASSVGAPPEQHRSSTTVLIVGGALLGLGAIFAGAGGLMIAATGEIGGAFLITLGAVVGFAALIVLLVGAIMAATEPRAKSVSTDDE